MQSQMSTPQPSSATPQNLSLSWRDNGGVTASTGRAAKRKRECDWCFTDLLCGLIVPFESDASDERFDPYGHPTKRRAVSPAISLTTSTPTSTPASHPLLQSLSSSPMSIVPRSPISNGVSSYSYGGSTTPSSRSVHSSPILRPVHRLPTSVREREERERAKAVSGARNGVRSINLSGS